MLAFAAPALLALGYYRMTGDPSFQPLDLTAERLIARGEDIGNEVIHGVVTIEDTARGRMQGEALATALVSAFRGKGMESNFRLLSTPAAPPLQIYLYVDGLHLGPFTPGNATQGLRMAVDAMLLSRAERQSVSNRARDP